MPPKEGFATYEELADHFYRHVTRARSFAFSTEEEYEAAAIEFMNRPLDADTEEYERTRDKTTIRFNKTTKEICYRHEGGNIGTYYKVNKADSNKAYEYFLRKCERPTS